MQRREGNQCVEGGVLQRYMQASRQQLVALLPPKACKAERSLTWSGGCVRGPEGNKVLRCVARA